MLTVVATCSKATCGYLSAAKRPNNIKLPECLMSLLLNSPKPPPLLLVTRMVQENSRKRFVIHLSKPQTHVQMHDDCGPSVPGRSLNGKISPAIPRVVMMLKQPRSTSLRGKISPVILKTTTTAQSRIAIGKPYWMILTQVMAPSPQDCNRVGSPIHNPQVGLSPVLQMLQSTLIWGICQT